METNLKKKRGLMLAMVLVIMLALAGNVSAKKLYVLSNVSSSEISLSDYGIAPNGLINLEGTYDFPKESNQITGMAVDGDSEYLFMTRIYQSGIRIVNTKTMTYEGLVSTPYFPAGIVMDHDNGKVYALYYRSPRLFSYSWDATAKTLTYDETIDLPGFGYSDWPKKGIAIDEVNDLLYVGFDRRINVYRTSDWSPVKTINLTQEVTSIALDVPNGILYAGSYGPGSYHLLQKYDLNTDYLTMSLNVRTLPGAAANTDNVCDIAVDPASGNVYVTTCWFKAPDYGSDRIVIFDSDLNVVHSTGDIGFPHALAIDPYIYEVPVLSKTDGVDEAYPGDDLSYTISYLNDNSRPLSGVTIVDNLPADVSFVSASDGGVYDSVNHRVSWSVGDLAAGVSGSVSVNVTVDSGASAGTVLSNEASITCEQTPVYFVEDTTTVQGFIPLGLSKTDGMSVVFAGDALTYQLSYGNGNPREVSGVTILDYLPAEVSFVSASDGGVYDPVNNVVSWDLGTVGAGVSGSVSVNVKVDSGTSAGTVLINEASIACDQAVGTTAFDDTEVVERPVSAPEFASLALLALLMVSPAFAYLLARRR